MCCEWTQQTYQKNALIQTPPGKRKRDRPRTTWKRTTNKDIAEEGLTIHNTEELANDRSRWRQLVETLCHRQG